MNGYRERRERLSAWIRAEGLDAAIIEDWEGRRNGGVRYLSGLPGDASLIVFADGTSVLLPWDVNMAEKRASVERIVPFGDYKRDMVEAARDLIPGTASRIELSGGTPFIQVEKLSRGLDGIRIECREGGLDACLERFRRIKDTAEIEAHMRAAEVTNGILDSLEGAIRADRLAAELDVAMFIEAEARGSGAEGTSFESIVAAPSRSFGIHAVPSFTSAPFIRPGMSIIDFGVRCDGYVSDVTVTVLRGPLNGRQSMMVDLVTEAYAISVSLAKPGASTAAIARAVDELFASQGFTMPHSLGHGLGLDVHEPPTLKDSPAADTALEDGMIFTLEPGLYDPEAGGVRFENDVLMTGGEGRVITNSRLIRIP